MGHRRPTGDALTCGELIEVAKVVVGQPRKKVKSLMGHREYDVDIHAAGVEGRFAVFVRVPTLLVEEFSIGLSYRVQGERVRVLLRVNGDHGQHRNRDGSLVDGPHVHVPDSSAYPSAIRVRGPADAAPLEGGFATVEAGWVEFCRRVNLRTTSDVDTVIRRLNFASAQSGLGL